MANNCWNHVTLTGDEKKLNLLIGKLNAYKDTTYFTEWGDYILGVGEIGDTPEVFEKRHVDTYYNYGTKWWDFEVDDLYLDNKTGQCDLTITGDSAWSPPIELIEQICKKYKLTAEMEYEEGGMDFAGKLKIDKNGIQFHEEMSSHEYRYKDDIISWIENLAYNYEGEEDYDEIFLELKEQHEYASDDDLLDLLSYIKKMNSK